MPLALRALAATLACLLVAAPASAEITDPDLTCADYLKTGQHKADRRTRAGASHEAATIEAKVRAFCAANPKMKAIDAEMTMTGL